MMRFGMTKAQWRVLIALGIIDFIVIIALTAIILSSLLTSTSLSHAPAPVSTFPPTWTPAPQYTATPDLALAFYMASVKPEVQALGVGLEEIASLMEEGGRSDYLTNEWIDHFVEVLLALDDRIAVLRAIQPPVSAHVCHAHLLSSLDHYSTMTFYLSYGVSIGDATAIRQGTLHGGYATTNLGTYADCISRLR